MSFLSKLMNAVGTVLGPQRTHTAPRSIPGPARPAPKAGQARGEGSGPAAPGRGDQDSPGRSGPDRTEEIDPHGIGAVRMSYAPNRDGDPDPGEIVWTWVPFEENDGQGKDRPTLVVAAESSGTVLVVQLTSKDHDGQSEFVPVGAGDWDGQHRESWVNLERVLRVHPSGMRREAASLPKPAFDTVAARLRSRYGWS